MELLKRTNTLAGYEHESESKFAIKHIPARCPKCNHAMDVIRISAEYAECPDCHHKTKNLQLSLGGGFAVGALIGLGVVGFLALLSKNNS